MANASYDIMWQDAMADLNEQLHVEGIDQENEAPGQKSDTRDVTIFQAFQHFACLYIKYLQIFRRLEVCYDCMIHPQKRLHVRKVLELVIRRIIELKNDLVVWNPPNSYVKIPKGPEEAFPWEYVHLDDILVDLKLSPETLEIPVPKYFREDNAKQLDQRDRLVLGYMRLKHETEDIFLEDRFNCAMPSEEMTLDKAIEIIQRNERGRQGYDRAYMVKEIRDKERQGRMYEASAQVEMDGDIAATNLQRMFRGFQSRQAAAMERENELVFVGMRPRKDNVESLEAEMKMAYAKRKQEQKENIEIYCKALEDLKDVIMDEEGPDKRDNLREERTLWVTDEIAQEKFPEDLLGFYANKIVQVVEDPEDAKGKKPEKAAKKPDKKEKGKKGAAKEEKKRELPKLQGKTVLTEQMFEMVEDFEENWESRDEADNFQQRHDVELAKNVVRPGVFEDIRLQVDEMLIMNLKKIRIQIAPGKGGKAKKGKGKKGKGKKGKKDKGKKKKPLPGEKISELKGLDADQMLSILIEYNMVVRCREKKVQSLIGDFNYLGSMHHNAERKDQSVWSAQDPSIAQIRQSITEYCILPNGSQDVKENIKEEHNIKTIMLFGPSGSGKTLMVEAVAHELGGLLIHLTPDKLRGLFPGKSGPTKLVHLVMTVARDPSMQPVVVYIDNCEQFFMGGGKKAKGDKDGPARFKKDLLLYKAQALEAHHRVIIIGTSKTPENGDIKELKNFFDRFLYFPYPDYASRVLIWSHYIDAQIRLGCKAAMDQQQKTHNDGMPVKLVAGPTPQQITDLVRGCIDRLDLSSLGHISEGYSAGAIAKTVRTIISNRRVAMIKVRPLNTLEFIENLALQPVTYQDDKNTYMSFIRAVSGLDDRRKKIESMLAGGGDEGDDKKKKKK